MELNKDAPRDLLDPDYIQYGSGCCTLQKIVYHRYGIID
jgi:hypothetical protein